MKRRIMHFLFTLVDRLARWRDRYDICELCGEGTVDTCCYEGCGKRICCDCESFYYEDATICIECEQSITPEELEADRKMMEDAERGLDLEEQ